MKHLREVLLQYDEKYQGVWFLAMMLPKSRIACNRVRSMHADDLLVKAGFSMCVNHTHRSALPSLRPPLPYRIAFRAVQPVGLWGRVGGTTDNGPSFWGR